MFFTDISFNWQTILWPRTSTSNDEYHNLFGNKATAAMSSINNWKAECVEYFTSNRCTVSYIDKEQCDHRHIDCQAIDNAADNTHLTFINCSEVFRLKRLPSYFTTLQFLLGVHIVKVAECKYYRRFCVFIRSRFRPAILCITCPFDRFVVRFRDVLYDSHKNSVLYDVYKFFWMLDLQFDDE